MSRFFRTESYAVRRLLTSDRGNPGTDTAHLGRLRTKRTQLMKFGLRLRMLQYGGCGFVVSKISSHSPGLATGVPVLL